MKRKGQELLTIISVLVLVILAYSVFNFNATITDILVSYNQENLSSEADERQRRYLEKINSEIHILQSVTNNMLILGEENDSGREERLLESVENYYGFTNIMVVDTTGLGIIHTGDYINIAHKEYFQNSLNGKIEIYGPTPSIRTGETMLTISLPIYEDDVVAGVLAAEYRPEYFEDIIASEFSSERGYTFVIDSDGAIISSVQREEEKIYGNVFSYFEKATSAQGSVLEQLKIDLASSGSGSLTYTINDIENIAEYRPLFINDWSLLVILNTQTMQAEANEITNLLYIFSFAIVLIFGVILAYVVSSRSKHINEVEKIAYYDELTGLTNIIKFKIDIMRLLKAHPNKEFGIIKFDVVNFKSINAMYSYEVGNSLIQAVGNALKYIDADIKAMTRMGVDEFVLFANKEFCEELEVTRHFYESIVKEMMPNLKGHDIGFRYGRYYINQNDTEINNILDKVNLAHTTAKNQNTSMIVDYYDDLQMQVISNMEVQNKMYTALENDEFKVFLQAKVNLQTQEIEGAEALVRWIEKDNNIIPPFSFIDLFEANGFIVNLDMYMLKKVCEHIQMWIEKGYKAIPISINFSRLHLLNQDFVYEICQMTKKYNVPNHLIEIELTETIMTENEDKMRAVVKDLRKEGFLVSIDDFGSGYSSLGLLKNIFVDTIKIDRTFFISYLDKKKANIVIENVISMIHSLGMKTVAEGIETQEQIDFLKETGCELAQGYFYSRPTIIQDFEQENIFNKD